jgi:hypothetical protein
MSTQYRLVVGKDCQRRLLSRPRFVRAVAPRIIIIIIIITEIWKRVPYVKAWLETLHREVNYHFH